MCMRLARLLLAQPKGLVLGRGPAGAAFGSHLPVRSGGGAWTTLRVSRLPQETTNRANNQSLGWGKNILVAFGANRGLELDRQPSWVRLSSLRSGNLRITDHSKCLSEAPLCNDPDGRRSCHSFRQSPGSRGGPDPHFLHSSCPWGWHNLSALLGHRRGGCQPPKESACSHTRPALAHR